MLREPWRRPAAPQLAPNADVAALLAQLRGLAAEDERWLAAAQESLLACGAWTPDDPTARRYRLWRTCGAEPALDLRFVFAAVLAADAPATWRAHNPSPIVSVGIYH